MRGSIFTAIPLLALAGAVTGCSERTAATAPLADAVALNPAGFIGDRPYTWSFKCNGNSGILAGWSWTENGTVLVSSSAYCSGNGQLSGTGVRPAAANGFTATVGNNSKSWTFDPAGPFTASLSDSSGGSNRHCSLFCNQKESGQLSVDS